MESSPGPETVLNGVKYLYFSGTSYMGLAGHPEVIKAGCEALQKYGVHTGASRAKYGTNPPVLDVENNASQFFGSEDAFYFGSGYVANLLFISTGKTFQN